MGFQNAIIAARLVTLLSPAVGKQLYKCEDEQISIELPEIEGYNFNVGSHDGTKKSVLYEA